MAFKMTGHTLPGPMQKRKCSKPYKKKDCDCWPGHKRVRGTKPCAEGSCEKI